MTTQPTSGAADLPETLDAIADSQYLAGVSAGWNAANADDPNAALQKLHESRAGYLKPLRDAQRAALAAGQAISAEPAGAGYAELPESLMLAVDRWLADNTGLGGCSGKDVRGLAELFYDVTHEGGRESVDDALAIVESFGPGIGGLNDTYARQVLLAAEVTRLRGIYKSAVAGRASMRDALRASHGQAPAGATQEPIAFIHWPINGPPRLGWYSQKALNDAILKTYEGHQPDVKLYTPQAAHNMNSTEPIAVTTGYYGGQATVKALDETLVLPVGIALYTAPQPSPTAQAAESVPAPVQSGLVATMLDALRHAQKVLNHNNLHLECGPVNAAILAARAPAESVLEDAARYRLVRRGQHWSVIDGIGNDLRGEALDAAVDTVRSKKGGAA